MSWSQRINSREAEAEEGERAEADRGAGSRERQVLKDAGMREDK